MNWLIFWIAALATYRFTIFISRDKVPGSWLRKSPLNIWAKCVFCVSPYMAWIVCVLLWLSGIEMHIAMWFLLSMAFSAITIALDRTFSADITND